MAQTNTKGGSKFRGHVTPLLSVENLTANPGLLEDAQAVLRDHACDSAVMFYPVYLEPLPEGQCHSLPVCFAVLLEIQRSGQPSNFWFMHLLERAGGINHLSSPTPVEADVAGLIYPRLLD